jgi:hypothetical protein
VEQGARYLPWLVGSAFLTLIVVSRLLSNHYIKLHYPDILMKGLQPGRVPQWFSALYMIGFMGLFVCGIWCFRIAWWAFLPMLAIYFLQAILIPSAILKATQDQEFGRHQRCASCGKLRPPHWFAIDNTQQNGHTVICESCQLTGRR